MNPLARAIIRCAAAPAAFTYDDIPDQLLRINSLEGSLAFSGAVLTGVTDVSGAGETVTVTGSPVYTASDAGLNGAPSFSVLTQTDVVAPNINRANINFVACVYYRGGAFHYAWDSTTGANVSKGAGNGTTSFLVNSTNLTVPSFPLRFRMLIPIDGTTATTVNGSSVGTVAANAASSTGILFGIRLDGASATRSGRIAFFMACSAVPSAGVRASLEAKLLTDFG